MFNVFFCECQTKSWVNSWHRSDSFCNSSFWCSATRSERWVISLPMIGKQEVDNHQEEDDNEADDDDDADNWKKSDEEEFEQETSNNPHNKQKSFFFNAISFDLENTHFF